MGAEKTGLNSSIIFIYDKAGNIIKEISKLNTADINVTKKRIIIKACTTNQELNE